MINSASSMEGVGVGLRNLDAPLRRDSVDEGLQRVDRRPEHPIRLLLPLDLKMRTFRCQPIHDALEVTDHCHIDVLAALHGHDGALGLLAVRLEVDDPVYALVRSLLFSADGHRVHQGKRTLLTRLNYFK